MNIAQLKAIGTGDRSKLLPQPRTSGDGFGDVMTGALDRVDSLQKKAETTMTEFIAGERDDVHEVVISMNEAQLAFQFLTETRNKLMDGYQELMRMQV